MHTVAHSSPPAAAGEDWTKTMKLPTPPTPPAPFHHHIIGLQTFDWLVGLSTQANQGET